MSGGQPPNHVVEDHNLTAVPEIASNAAPSRWQRLPVAAVAFWSLTKGVALARVDGASNGRAR